MLVTKELHRSRDDLGVTSIVKMIIPFPSGIICSSREGAPQGEPCAAICVASSQSRPYSLPDLTACGKLPTHCLATPSPQLLGCAGDRDKQAWACLLLPHSSDALSPQSLAEALPQEKGQQGSPGSLSVTGGAHQNEKSCALPFTSSGAAGHIVTAEDKIPSGATNVCHHVCPQL